MIVGLLSTGKGAELAAEALGVGTAIHQAACEAYGLAGGFRGRGHAVVRVLEAVKVDPKVLVRILRSGATAQIWTEPWMWQDGSWKEFPQRE